jgi:AcrR family transcriptional regulator
MALLNAAEQILIEEGYGAVTTRRVAARAGINPGLIHYYFGTLDDLFVALFRHVAERILARQQRALASAQPLRGLWDLAMEPRGTALLLEFMALANHRKTIRAEIAAYTEVFRRAEREALAALVATDSIDLGGIPPGVMAVLIAAIARSLVMEKALGMTSSHDETMDFVDELLRGFEPSPDGLGADPIS